MNKDIEVGLNELEQALVKSYYGWYSLTDMDSSDKDPIKITFEKGRNYARIVRDGRSAVGFVCLVDNPKKGFVVGDILKSASWNAPATNFARGNLFREGWQKCVNWAGIN